MAPAQLNENLIPGLGISVGPEKGFSLHEKHHPALPLHGPTAGQIQESSTEPLDINKFCFIVSVQQTVISGI